MLIAIDHGNYAIKTPHASFVAGLAEHTSKPPMTEEVIKYNGKYWTLTGSRMPYKRDKTSNERYFILTLFAIAKELGSFGRSDSTYQLDLAIGTPPEHYGVLKGKFSRYFHRDEPIKFLFNGTPYKLSIKNVFVYPQAFAAMVPYAPSVLNSLRTFIVDIGGYTTDVLLLRNGKPDLQFCRSLESGVITMNNEIIRKVNSFYDLHIVDEQISAALQGDNQSLPEDAVNIIKDTAQQHVEYILDSLRELHVDLRSNPSVFIGGGSILFKDLIQASDRVSRVEFITDPKANAIGYQLLAERQLEKMNNN